MQFTDSSVTMTKGEARCLYEHACKDPYRTNLHGVVVDFSLRRAWVTDGHRAAVCADSKAKARAACMQPVLLPLALFEVAARYHTSTITRCDDFVIWRGFDRAGAHDRDRGVSPLPRASLKVAVAHEAKPPNISAALVEPQGQEAPAPMLGINPAYLGGLHHLRAAGCDVFRMRTPHNPLDSVIAEGEGVDGSTWLIVIMPVRL